MAVSENPHFIFAVAILMLLIVFAFQRRLSSFDDLWMLFSVLTIPIWAIIYLYRRKKSPIEPIEEAPEMDFNLMLYCSPLDPKESQRIDGYRVLDMDTGKIVLEEYPERGMIYSSLRRTQILNRAKYILQYGTTAVIDPKTMQATFGAKSHLLPLEKRLKPFGAEAITG